MKKNQIYEIDGNNKIIFPFRDLKAEKQNFHSPKIKLKLKT